MVQVAVENLRKSFGAVSVVKDVSFVVPTGSVLTLLGPSGCGKTTILRCIAGLEWASAGRIKLGSDVVFDGGAGIAVPSEKREIGMVFQSYAIWPHLTVFDNVAFPLRLRGLSKSKVRTDVMDALRSVGLDHLHDRFPSQLSGGQQQRAVLARCLVYRPRVLLLDEPLANLDASLREEMRFELREVQQKFGLTSIYVTHDQAEAMALSDNIIVLSGGRIVSEGGPREVFSKPRHRFVASFLGGANLMPAKIVGAQDGAPRIVGLDDKGVLQIHADGAVGAEVAIAIRPADLTLLNSDAGQHGVVPGVLQRVTYLGEAIDCVVSVAGHEVRVRTDPDGDWQPGQAVFIKFHATRVHLMPASEN